MKNKNIFGYLFFGFFMLSILYFGGHLAYFLIEKYRPSFLTCVAVGLGLYFLMMVFFYWVCAKNAEDEPEVKND